MHHQGYYLTHMSHLNKTNMMCNTYSLQYVYIDIIPIYTLITWRLYIQNLSLSLSGDLNPTNIVQRVWNIVNNKLFDVKCLAGGDSELFPSVGLKTCRFRVNVIMIIHDPRIYCLACAARMAACQLLAIKHNNIQQYTVQQPSFPFHILWAQKWNSRKPGLFILLNSMLAG